MLAQPSGGAPSRATADDTLTSFALQHPIRSLWGLAADAWLFTSSQLFAGAAIVGMGRRGWVADRIGRLAPIPTAGQAFEARDTLNDQVRQAVLRTFVEEYV